ncbi:MAG: D-alanine--D-alanine ligase [Proteobacteria bacterium]|jgi:D-alanine-D-alanine ligase|nr:D-alanine--D-alanine ligase [Pseudomonadota bacterium]
MKIGLTYDLKEEYLALGFSEEETAELDKPATIEGVEAALRANGWETERVGNHLALMAALAAGRRWDLVFNIAEGLRGLGRESLVPCLLDAFDIPYTFSDPMVLALSLHKGMCKRAVRDAGVPTAPFLVVERLADLEHLALRFPLFAKPVAEGTGKGISAASRIGDREALLCACDDLLRRFGQPVLVEEFLPGREFTVGVLGTGRAARPVAVMEVLFREEGTIYSYATKENYLERVDYALADDPALEKGVADVALGAWRALGCRDGGRVDVRLDDRGRPMFIEVNPLAGLNPVDSDLPIMCRLSGRPYEELIGEIVRSALSRIEDARRRPA